MSGFIEKTKNRYMIQADSAKVKKLEIFLKKERDKHIEYASQHPTEQWPVNESIKFWNGFYDAYDKFLSDVKTKNLQDEFIDFIETAPKITQPEQLKAFSSLSPQLQKLIKGAYLITPFGVDAILYGWASALS